LEDEDEDEYCCQYVELRVIEIWVKGHLRS